MRILGTKWENEEFFYIFQQVIEQEYNKPIETFPAKTLHFYISLETLPLSAPQTVAAVRDDVGAFTSSLSEKKEIINQNIKFRKLPQTLY